ncbi:MAG TPA: hypothetical protein VFE61_11435 [Candidatus Sulfotelmatobacter sp.]|jgi:hypothetical protein|nr:hypothetical protein [Candidatus Sulfotelmatobacter sp.]
MATLQQQIANKFLKKLAESKKVDADKIEQLEKLLAQGKKLKADEFVKIFSLPAGVDMEDFAHNSPTTILIPPQA